MGRPIGYFHKYRKTTPYRHHTSGRPRVVIYMDEETYEDMDALAKENDCSVSEQARILIEVGLEQLKLEKNGS